MNLMDIFDLGFHAYHDGVPSYKNPYNDNNHYDDSEHTAWRRGWFAAGKEHELFTENQTLKAKNEELFLERAEALDEVMCLKDDVFGLKSELDLIRESFSLYKESSESQLVEISTLLKDLYYYSTDSSIFTFRRENLIQMIQNVRDEIKKEK